MTWKVPPVTDRGPTGRRARSTVAGLPRLLVVGQIAGVMLLAGLATVGYLSTNAMLDAHRDDAELINLAGRQRMLAQRAARHVLVGDADAASADLDELRKQQPALLMNDPDVVAAHAEATSALNRFGSEAATGDVDRTVAALQDFMPRAELLVAALQHTSEGQLAELSATRTLVLVILLAVMAAHAPVLFAPAWRQLRRWRAELVDSNARLAAERRTLQQLFDEAAVGYSECDLDRGRILRVNARLCEMLGYQSGDLVGRTFEEITHPEDRGRNLELFRRFISGDVPEMRLTKRYIRRDGGTCWAEVACVLLRNADGQPQSVIANVLDATDARVAEERYRLVCDGSHDALWDRDLQTDELYWSPKLYQMLGLQPEQWAMTPDSFYGRVHPDDVDALGEAVKAHLERRVPLDMEYRLRRHDGSYLWVRGRGQARWDAEGRPVRLAGGITDISRTKLTEDALRASERRNRAVIDNLGEVVFQTDADGSFDLLNPAWEPISGRQVGTSLGRPAARWLAPERDGEADLDEVFRGVGEVRRLACELQHAAGATRHVEVSTRPRFDAAGRHAGCIGTIADVTEKRQAQRRLRGQRDLFEQIVRLIPSAVFWKDRDGVYEGCNDTFAEWAMLDTTAEVRGMDDRDMPWAGELADEFVADDRAVMASGEPKLDYEEQVDTGAGDRLVLRTSKIPLRNESGDVVGVLGVAEDVTARKLAESALVRSRAEADAAKVRAEDASRAKSEFLANMSHEIRTPMTAILGFTDLLADAADSGVDPDDVRRHVETIRRNGTHLLAVLNDILDLSKIEAGRLAIEPQPCDVAALATDVLEVMAGRTGSAVKLSLVYDTPVPRVLNTDPTRLRQVLLNLLSNAVKFTAEGSVTLSLAAAGGRLRLSVVDTGIGIPHDVQAKLLTPFEQGDTSVTRRFGGTGLGLAISRRLAETLGGQLQFCSEPGQGSTFTLVLDTDADAQTHRPEGRRLTGRVGKPETPAAEEAPAADTPGRPLVLLVEDGPDNQRLLTHQLRRGGYDVEVAGNGRIALEALARGDDEGRPHRVVLMDMQMPEMDGYAATRALRQRGDARPVVALTAHAMDGDRRRCLEAGCDDYATKPIDRAKLLDTVARHLARDLDASAPAAATPAVIRSSYADDEDMAALVADFVAEMPGHVEAIDGLLGDATPEGRDRLRRVFHQLKGSGGGYGFAGLTDAAAAAEKVVKAGADDHAIEKAAGLVMDYMRAVDGYKQSQDDDTPGGGDQEDAAASAAAQGQARAADAA